GRPRAGGVGREVRQGRRPARRRHRQGHLEAVMRDREGGQASVEAALVLPLVITMLLAVVQVGLVVRAEVLVTHAAREAARAAAVNSDPQAATSAARLATTLDGDRMTVAVRGRDGPGSRVQV